MAVLASIVKGCFVAVVDRVDRDLADDHAVDHQLKGIRGNRTIRQLGEVVHGNASCDCPHRHVSAFFYEVGDDVKVAFVGSDVERRPRVLIEFVDRRAILDEELDDVELSGDDRLVQARLKS